MTQNKIKIYVCFLSLMIMSQSSYASESRLLSVEQVADRENDIRESVKKISRDIAEKNIDGILEAIAENHMCGDKMISKDRISDDLHNENSMLYIRLFNSQKYSETYKSKKSLSDSLAQHDLKKIPVSFINGEKTLAEVYISYYIDFLFVFENNKWLLVEGLYDCP